MSIIEDAKNAAQGAVQTAMKKAVAARAGQLDAGRQARPADPTSSTAMIGEPVSRLDGPLKVQGAAPFAAEFPLDGMVYAALAFSTVAEGPHRRIARHGRRGSRARRRRW